METVQIPNLFMDSG